MQVPFLDMPCPAPPHPLHTPHPTPPLLPTYAQPSEILRYEQYNEKHGAKLVGGDGEEEEEEEW